MVEEGALRGERAGVTLDGMRRLPTLRGWRCLRGGRGLGAAVAFACAAAALAPAACGVPRATPTAIEMGDYSTLPNLRRAQEALQDTITREKEHVEALKLQIVQLRTDEDELYQSFLKAETDYHLRATDLAGVEADLAAAQHDLDTGRTLLADLQAQLTAVEGEIAGLLARVTAQRELLGGAQQEFDAVLAGLQARLQAALPPPAPPPAAPSAPPTEPPADPPAGPTTEPAAAPAAVPAASPTTEPPAAEPAAPAELPAPSGGSPAGGSSATGSPAGALAETPGAG